MMANDYSIDEIVGANQVTYDVYFQQADVHGSGIVSAIDGAQFLKQSKLNDQTLKEIWELSDSYGRGYLDRQGFYIALKLISLVQSNEEIKLENLVKDTSAPKLGELQSNMISLVSQNDPWYIKASLKQVYDKTFDSLSPINNRISGTRIKPMLMSTGLPIDILGRIWDMSDLDADGQLDRAEFHIAMHLVAKAKEGLTIGDQLPPALLPYKKGRLMSNIATATYVDTPKVWVVTAEEKIKSDLIFNQLDTDNDGYVNGFECKDVFLKTSLPSQTLASIWNLCDSNGSGRLNGEQFALAMYFINKKLSTGHEPPLELTLEMIPPSMRPKVFTSEMSYTNKELDELQNQVTELQREKLFYEQRASEHDTHTRQKRTELSNLELELDSLYKTLRDREQTKSDDQKKLSDYSEKITRLTSQLDELRRKYDTERVEVENLRFQINNTESAHLNKEQELNRIRNDTQILRKEKLDLDAKLNMRRMKYTDLQQNLNQIELEIQANRENVSTLRQIQDLSNRLVKEYNSGNIQTIQQLENDLSKSQETINNANHRYSFNTTNQSGSFFNNSSQFAKIESQFDPFGTIDPFGQQQITQPQFDDSFGAFKNDPFTGSQPLQNDPFTGAQTLQNDPFSPFREEASDVFAMFDSDVKKKAPPPRPAPPRPITPSLKAGSNKLYDFSKRPQSAMDFTHNSKLNIFPNLDPFGASSSNDNWAAFGTSQSTTANNTSQFDPFL